MCLPVAALLLRHSQHPLGTIVHVDIFTKIAPHQVCQIKLIFLHIQLHLMTLYRKIMKYTFFAHQWPSVAKTDRMHHNIHVVK